MNKKIILTGLAAAGVFMLAGCQGSKETVKLSPKEPVNITVWHYYNGMQQEAFDNLVKEFNDSFGKEEGIYVTGYSQGSVTDLEENITASMNKEVGSQEMPTIFSTYADTAYALEQTDGLADLSEYLTEEDMKDFIPSYIEEGKIGKNGELRIFPVAKSSEVFMMNKTAWDAFSKETGADISQLETKEGLAEAAQQYYEWTDAQTPDIPNDGKAFYGRDAMANLFIIGSMQLGSEIFSVEYGKVTLDLDKEVMKKIWDNYYIPYVKGYFGAYGKFRSDDVKTGDLAAFTGSTSSSMYFPEAVETGDSKEMIAYMVLPTPRFAEGEKYAVQQGAGMAVTKSDKKTEYAAVEFLKWFTQNERNIEFGCSSGYLPVRKKANNKETLDKVIEEKEMEVSTKTYDTLLTEFDVLKDNTMYANKAFEGGVQARKILEYHMQDSAKAAREQVEAALTEGRSLEDAAGAFISEEAFENWYEAFKGEMEQAIER